MLTIEQKAKAFDMIANGSIQGMSKFWLNFSELQPMSDDEVLRRMARFACQEAIEFVLMMYPIEDY